MRCVWLLLACSSPPVLGPSHGGAVQQVGGWTLETNIQQSGIRVWVYDAGDRLVPADQLRGTASVRAANGVQQAEFAQEGDGLRARAKLPPGEPASATLALLIGAHTLRAEVSTDRVGGIGFQEETPAHGGEVVIVDGQLRVEYAPARDLHVFWLTDLQRRAIRGEVVARVKDGGIDVPAKWDPELGRVVAPWAGAGSRPTRLELEVDGEAHLAEFAP